MGTSADGTAADVDENALGDSGGSPSRRRCDLCTEGAPGAEEPQGPLERPCGCYQAPDGVHLSCLLRTLEERGGRWWTELSCPSCGWWYVGRAAVPLAEAGLAAAERAHGSHHPDVATALLVLSRALRGASAAASVGGRCSAAIRRRAALERAVSVLEVRRDSIGGCAADGAQTSTLELAAALEELAQICGELDDGGQGPRSASSLLARAFQVGSSSGAAASRAGGGRNAAEVAARRARVMGRLADVLRRHGGEVGSTGEAPAAVP
mmetsp:Transcript_79786/g.222086  ORF Transcript_79786/g.222086 Transcript_79786/m.222086 type:complete len:266 (+) Transcript_79786:235-1032(+)